MSRLVNYGAGEIADRLTILALKIAYASLKGADTEHWATERNALLVQARAKDMNLEDVLSLASVNAVIWQSEDELRRYRHYNGHAYGPADLEAIRVIAFRLQDLNDQRAKYIESLNKDAGDFRGAEKVAV